MSIFKFKVKGWVGGNDTKPLNAVVELLCAHLLPGLQGRARTEEESSQYSGMVLLDISYGEATPLKEHYIY